MSEFEIIYTNPNKSPKCLNEHDLKEWLCEHVLQQRWYGENGLSDEPRFHNEDGSLNDLWFSYIDEVLDDLIYSIEDKGEIDGDSIDGYQCEGSERPSIIIKCIVE